MPINVTIAIIIFNRPKQTRALIDRLSLLSPETLYVVSDGPRGNVKGEAEKCAQVREVIDNINWNCEIHKDYSPINLGCQKRISTGLDWVFSQVDSAIILEDDCLPELSFFRFCHELLERYALDNRVMSISGDNFQFGRKRSENSYYFSRYPHCWGWATWRRAWQYYDTDMTLWPQLKASGGLQSILDERIAARYWHQKFQKTYDGLIDSWNYVWALSCWLQNGLCILPNVNLVSNTGFGIHGTHHTYADSPFAAMPTQPIEFPLRHPQNIVRHARADRFTQSYQYGLWARGLRRIQGYLR